METEDREEEEEEEEGKKKRRLTRGWMEKGPSQGTPPKNINYSL